MKKHRKTHWWNCLGGFLYFSAVTGEDFFAKKKDFFETCEEEFYIVSLFLFGFFINGIIKGYDESSW
jgi:hypothetical protein